MKKSKQRCKNHEYFTKNDGQGKEEIVCANCGASNVIDFKIAKNAYKNAKRRKIAGI